MDKNKELCELLEIPWKDTYRCEEDNNNPDFTTPDGIVLLLREMMKRKDWKEFVDKIGGQTYHPDHEYKDYIPLNYILNITGKLRHEVIAWLERRKG